MYPLSDNYCQRTNTSKPEFPYLRDRILTLRSHHPPAPTTSPVHLNPKIVRERESVHPLARCLLHPPLPGQDGKVTVNLQITGPIRAGDNHSAQLVTVRVQSSSSDDLPRDQDLVAKIYDPLYFDHEQDDADPFLCVDRDYSHETAAYQVLSPLQGGIIPKYYGSFTIEIRAGARAFRYVRLILIEFVPAPSMQQLKTSGNLSQEDRQTIMKAVIDAESLIYTHNILHKDIRSANILVCLNSKIRPVVIIDFGRCSIGRHFIPRLHETCLPGVPISPLIRWDNTREEFKKWIDADWESWLERVYGSTRASITEEMLSIWKPLDPPPVHFMEIDYSKLKLVK